jgi:hypothetical protein
MPRPRCAPLRQAAAGYWDRQRKRVAGVAGERKYLVFFLYSVGYRTAASAPDAVRARGERASNFSSVL